MENKRKQKKNLTGEQKTGNDENYIDNINAHQTTAPQVYTFSDVF